MAGGAGRGEAKRRPRRLVALRLRGRGWTRALCSASPSPIGHRHRTVTVVTVRSPLSPYGRRRHRTVAVWSPLPYGHRSPLLAATERRPAPQAMAAPTVPNVVLGCFFFFGRPPSSSSVPRRGCGRGQGVPQGGRRRRFTASEQRPGCAMRIPPPNPGLAEGDNRGTFQPVTCFLNAHFFEKRF